MATAITVPKEYGYVVATTAATFFVGLWHGVRIGSFRKASGIKYPKYYPESSDYSAAAPEKKHEIYLYSCAQRAHGNWLENHPSTAIAMLVAGLRWPIATSVMGLGWTISRIVYAVGYTRRDKTDGSGRLAGSGFWLFELGLYGMTAWYGAEIAGLV